MMHKFTPILIIILIICIYTIPSILAATDCSPGTYYELCKDDCINCPPGFYCEGGNATKIACPAGTHRSTTGGATQSDCAACASGSYSSLGSEKCTYCPLGFSCANPALPPQLCGAGTYTTELGATSCSNCPAGHYCPSPGERAVPCPKGTSASGSAARTECAPCVLGYFASQERSTSCTQCPAGSKCPTASLDPLPCPLGTYSTAGSHVCLLCEKGRHCLNPASPVQCAEGTFSQGGLITKCTECPEGTYSAAGATECIICGAGYACPNKRASTRSACPSSQFSPANHAVCEDCPPGTRVNTDRDDCTVCPTGSSCAGGDAAAVTCTVGYAAPFAGLSSCLRCQPGTYSSSSTTGGLTAFAACLECPPGKYCAGATAPQDCSPGYYSLGGAAYCLPAPAGTYTFNVAQFPRNCAPGEWSGPASATCSPCPAGSSCTLPSLTTRCPGGYFSREGEVSCQPCPVGYSCADPGNPTPCAAGTYSNVGDALCHNCPPGFYCPESSFYPIPCGDGDYSDAGQPSCTHCPAGSFCLDPSSPPVACPDGSYSAPGQLSCSKCREGSRCTTKAVAANEAPEVTCAAGTISAPGATECLPCPAGMACPDPKGFNPVVCTPGHYSTSGAESCLVCPQGSSCANPSVDPVPCPAGTFSYAGAAECIICPAGHYCTGGTALPTMCAAGRYSLAGESNAACQICDAGFDCVAGSTSSTPDDALCPSGSYCVAGDAKTLCPQGYYGVASGQPTQATGCALCPAGYFCAIGTETITEAIKCPRGYYCPVPNPDPLVALRGTTFATEFPCPAGTYNPTTGAISPGSCRICPAGYYCDTGTAHFNPFPCPPGWYCPEGSKGPTDAVQGPQRCPRGTYYSSWGAKNATDCELCPPGSYCGGDYRCDGTFIQSMNNYACPRQCPAGTYNPVSAAPNQDNCLPCPDGYTCPTASAHPRQHNCYPGYFCDEGTPCTIVDTTSMVCYPSRAGPDARCPAGTYTTSYGLKKEEDCSICWEGYACPSYAGNLACPQSPGLTNNGCPIGCEPGQDPCPAYTRTMIICSPGHYCPGAPVTGNASNPHTLANYFGEYTQYPDQYDCPAGTYSAESGLKSAAECTTCERGKYCTGGLTAPNDDCPQGFYCPRGTQFATQYACPAGTYGHTTGLYDVDDCTPCPSGSYCPEASTTYISCPAGTYNPSLGAKSLGPVTIEASLTAIQSGAWASEDENYHVYVALTRQLENTQCVICPAGFFCDGDALSTPTICSVGTYSGARSTNCTTCPAGHYCHRNGTREDNMRNVFVCPAGMYCPEGTAELPDKDSHACAPGKYCPRGISAPVDCPAGSFMPYTGAGRAEDCLECPRGQYCEQGSSVVTGNCSVGYYCPANSSNSRMFPCPANTYRDHEQAFSQDHCAVCPNGKYCPEGTGDPIDCPQGYYCIIGISIPLPCPIGTYGNKSQLIAITECTDCDPGHYCDTLGRTSPSGKCDAGYYCLLGAKTAAPIDGVTGDLCPRGGFCPVGSSGPENCAPGTFNNFTGGKTQADCAPCTPGYYCAGSSNPHPSGPCTAGYYCLSNDTVQASTPRQFSTTPGHYSVEGSKTEIPCPAGTYTTEYAKADNCDLCELGFYCPDVGQAVRDANPCPAGSYCPRGSILPTGCPKGTYGTGQRFHNSSQCLNCPVGQFCDGDRLIAPVGDCLPGYLCYGRSEKRNPVGEVFGDECPVGHYCLLGATSPSACGAGTYNPRTRSENNGYCLSCPAGHYCQGNALSAPTGDCSAGYYCPRSLSASSSTPGTNLCSIGRYCPQGTASQLMCPDGQETLSTGRSTCQPCVSSVYCSRGSQRTACPEGRYCGEGTGLVQAKCPPGTFSNTLNLRFLNECTLCTSGKFCSGWGLSTPDGDCLAGTYCESGASDIEGSAGVLGGSSGICPTGHYCPSGTNHPAQCPPGTFTSTTGLQNITNCQPCSAGFYCPEFGQNTTSHLCDEGYYCMIGANTPTPSGNKGSICPVGHYCPVGSPAPVPCPDGFYQDKQQQANCTSCPEGFFCEPGTSTPENCPAGHFCPNGTGIVIPKCPRGSYSNSTNLKAQNECTICDGGRFCSAAGLTAPDGNCKAGILCTNGASDESGTPGVLGGSSGICPKGHYCEEQTTTPVKCPIGTFANWTGNTNNDGCSPCTPGSYCSEEGVVDPTDYLCAAGYYCVQGAQSATPSDGVTGDICPPGSYCPIGTAFPIPCDPGTFSPTVNQTSCTVCPEGYYCEGRTVEPVICPAGFYCPNGTTYEIPECPPGSFSLEEGLKTEENCSLCTAGRFCSVPGLNAPNGICAQGYYCVNGSINSLGTPGELGGAGGICPPGHYCPLGSSAPLECSAGTYNPDEKRAHTSDCLPCPAREYCPTTGMSQPQGKCIGGFFCDVNETVSAPSESICPRGHFCPNATAFPHICVDGTFQDELGQIKCDPCPAGKYCTSNSTDPQPCPVGSYCPEGHGYPISCADGTYSLTGSLSSQSQCIACPPGKFCTNGVVRGACHAGYVCYQSSWTASPKGSVPVSIGELCPIGYYCPEGTINPVPCPAGTVGTAAGGRNETICGPCPKGYYCIGVSNVGEPCPPGRYCPPVAGIPILCPKGTYNPISRGTNATACLPCEAGHTCPDEGQATYTDICPSGHYCPTKSITPIQCPKGTFRNSTGGGNIESCAPCLAGHYCPEGTSNPIMCAPGTFCVPSSKEPVTCPEGYYCLTGESVPRLCPAGSYCPLGTQTPSLCPYESYCPSGTDVPVPCPYGYRTLLSNMLSRTSLADSCEICPPGYYGNTTNQLECYICDAGYVCLSGATAPNPVNVTTQRGYKCPAGSYCPAGSFAPLLCPAGTHRPSAGATRLEDCLPCEVNSYSRSTGATECRKCGTSSFSARGATTCTCTGANRVYQESDGTCLCRSGFTFFDQNNQEIFKDSTQDCIEIVFSRCASGQTHDSQGNCVSSTSGSCSSVCAAGGKFITAYGVCECYEAVQVDDVCNSACRSSRSRVNYNQEAETFSVVTSNGTAVTFAKNDISAGDLGRCEANSTSSCELHVVRSTINGFVGVYNPSVSYLSNLFNTSSSPTSKRSWMLKLRSTEEDTGILHPIVCLERGAGVLFDVSESKTRYPQYNTHSLLNTVPSFDYGPFRDLALLMPSNVVMKTFAHFFRSAGTYVFVDASDSSKLTIVRVLDAGETCPNDQTFMPITESNLLSLGISAMTSIPLTPDWNLMGLLLLGFFSLCASALGCLTYFKSKGWVNLNARHKKRISELTDISEKMKLIQSGDGSDFDINICLEELDLHGKNVTGDMSTFRDQFSTKYDNLLKETKSIRTLLERHKRQNKGIVDIKILTSELAAPKDASEIPGVVSKLQDQLREFEFERKALVDFADVDMSSLNLDQKDLVNQLKKLSVHEKEQLDETVRVYGDAHRKLKESENDLLNMPASSSDAQQKLSQFCDNLAAFKKDIAKQLEALNGTIAKKNELESNFSQKTHVFDLDDGTANQLKDFLSHKVREMFDKYKLNQEEEEEAESDDDDFERMEDELEEQEVEGNVSEQDGKDDLEEKEDEIDPNQSVEDRLEIVKKRRQKKLILKQKQEMRDLEEEVDGEFAKGQEVIAQQLSDIQDDYMTQMRKTTDEKLSTTELTPQMKQQVLGKLQEKTKNFTKQVNEDREKQTEFLKSVLEKKKEAKAALFSQKQEMERETFLQMEKEEKQAVKRITKKLLDDVATLEQGVSVELLKQKEVLKYRLATSKERLQKKQEFEKKELEKLMDAQDKLDRQSFKEEIKLQHKHLVDQKRKVYEDLAEHQANTREEKDQLMKEYNKKLTSYKKTLENQRKKAEEDLEEQLAHRRSVEQRQLENKHANEEAERITEQDRDLKTLRALTDSAAAANEDLEGARAREKLKQAKAIEQKLAELKQKHQEKKKQFKESDKKLEEAIVQELQDEEEKLNQKFVQDRKQQIKEKEDELTRKLQDPDMTDRKKEQLLATHRLQIQDYEEKMALLKDQQLKSLRSKMDEKLKALKQQRKVEQQKDLTKDLLEQEKQLDKHVETSASDLKPVTIDITLPNQSQLGQVDEVDDVERKRIREDEAKFETFKRKMEQDFDERSKDLRQSQQKRVFALKSKMQADLASSSEKEKERIVQEYNRQLDSLERKQQHEHDKQAEELAVRLEAHRKKLMKKRGKDLKELRVEQGKQSDDKLEKQRHEAERKKILDLLMDEKEPVYSIEDAINRVVLTRHNEETEALTAKQKEAMSKVTDEAKKTSLELKQTKKRIALKKKHLDEKKALAKEFEKYNDLLAKGNDHTRVLEDEFQQFSSQINKQKEENRKRIEAEKEKIRLAMEKEIEEARRKSGEERRILEERLREEKNKLQVKETIQQREQEVALMLEKQKNLEKGERERLLEQHKQHLNAFEEALEAERRRQERILADKVKALEERKIEEEKRKLHQKLEEKATGKRKHIEFPDGEEQTEDGKLVRNVKKLSSTMSLIHQLDHRGPQAMPRERIVGDETIIIEERKWMEPILQKIRNIEKLLSLQYAPYCDQKDLAIKENEGKLVPVPVEELNIPQLVVYKFGEFIIHLLRAKLNIRLPVHLAVASSLPHTNYAHNAFKYSFYYQVKTSTLFIRDVRLSHIGKFIVLLAHCMAHITFGELESDLHPDFVKNYYSMMEIIFEDIFNVRNRNAAPKNLNALQGDREQIVNQMFDLSARPLRQGDGLNHIRLQPGRTEVDLMMKFAQEKQQMALAAGVAPTATPPRAQFQPRGRPVDRASLEAELVEAQKEMRNNQQYIQSFTVNLKKVDTKVKEEEQALSAITDKSSLDYRKQEAKLNAYLKQRDDLAKKLRSTTSVHSQLQAKIADLTKKLADLAK